MKAKKENKKKEVKNKIVKRVGLVFGIVLIATFLDWLAHSSSPAFYVPYEYFQNKVIYATIWGLVALWLSKKVTNLTWKAFIFSGLIAIILQTKYLIQGYDLYFVFLFMLLHFAMFLAPSILLFRKYPEIVS